MDVPRDMFQGDNWNLVLKRTVRVKILRLFFQCNFLLVIFMKRKESTWIGTDHSDPPIGTSKGICRLRLNDVNFILRQNNVNPHFS